ncbi:MAG: hypothetical protein ACI8Z5_001051 [Lentimonas sp.]|jgi:hypothetical protein
MKAVVVHHALRPLFCQQPDPLRSRINVNGRSSGSRHDWSYCRFAISPGAFFVSRDIVPGLYARMAPSIF